MKKIKLNPADIFIFKPNTDLLGQGMKLLGLQAGHVAVFYCMTLDNEHKLKARCLEEGSQGMAWTDYEYNHKDVCIMRCIDVPNAPEGNMTHIRMYLKERLDNGTNLYGYDDLLDATFNEILEKATFGIWEKHNLLPDGKNDICSGMAGKLINIISQKEVVKETNVFSPEDFLKHKRFFIIKNFNEEVEYDETK